jgi:hypothetical protein
MEGECNSGVWKVADSKDTELEESLFIELQIETSFERCSEPGHACEVTEASGIMFERYSASGKSEAWWSGVPMGENHTHHPMDIQTEASTALRRLRMLAG